MLQFNARDRARLASALDEAETIHAEFEMASADYNNLIVHLSERFAEATEVARGIVEDAAFAADEYHDLKSEAWQEGDRGQAYAEWRDRLQQVAEAISDVLMAEETTSPDRPDWFDDLADDDLLSFNF